MGRPLFRRPLAVGAQCRIRTHRPLRTHWFSRPRRYNHFGNCAYTVSGVSFCGDITVKTFHNFLIPIKPRKQSDDSPQSNCVSLSVIRLLALLVLARGVEPPSSVPQTDILSIELYEHIKSLPFAASPQTSVFHRQGAPFEGRWSIRQDSNPYNAILQTARQTDQLQMHKVRGPTLACRGFPWSSPTSGFHQYRVVGQGFITQPLLAWNQRRQYMY